MIRYQLNLKITDSVLIQKLKKRLAIGSGRLFLNKEGELVYETKEEGMLELNKLYADMVIRVHMGMTLGIKKGRKIADKRRSKSLEREIRRKKEKKTSTFPESPLERFVVRRID